MKMNRIETLMMNNPLRAWTQRRHAAPTFRELGGRLDGARVLEAGCGNGFGIEILLDDLGAAEVHAFDLDPDMVDLARARTLRRGAAVKVWRGDLAQVPVEDGTFDAVVLFGVLHHLPDWRSALVEIRRVLRPGGKLFAEESCRKFIEHPLFRALLHHPREDRFSAEDLFGALDRAGFELLGRRGALGDAIVWCVAARVDGRKTSEDLRTSP